MDDFIVIDFEDYNQLVALMNRHEEFPCILFGRNSDDESQQISINEDNITVGTLQNNGWTRVNIYWRDGSREETFDGKWR